MFHYVRCRRAFVFAAPFVFSLLVACDKPDSGTGRLEQMRCKEDGLCWQAVGKRSIEGAYRKGDQEIKFDAVFSPGRSVMTQFKDEWSYRLLDRLGATIFAAKSSNPPDSWFGSDEHRLPQDIDEKMKHYRERNNLAYEAAQAIVQAEKPTGSLGEPWKQLCHYMQHQIIDSGHYGPNNTNNSPTTVKRYVDPLSPAASDDEEDKLAATTIDDEAENQSFSGEELLDDAERHEEMADGSTVEDADENAGELVGAQTNAPPLSLFAFSSAKNKKTNPAEAHHEFGMEYQQDVDLYWKHTRSFLAFGWKTGKHHTAACITVRGRRMDTTLPWEVVGKECTENHGTKAATGDMKLYAQCRDLPITRQYYIWKGECGGKFPSHYCNDDTALQIRHAYGVFDDGSKCLKRKRTHRPWCEKPW